MGGSIKVAIDTRHTMAKQINFWKIYLEHTKNFRCIYSDKSIVDAFSLDHYLPWSFVAHDQIWNLIAVNKEANSSKSNCLPDNKYYEDFKNIHFNLVNTTYKALHKTRMKYWQDNIEPYLYDMSMSMDDLFNKEIFYNNLDNTIKPLLRIAENHGFKANWTFY